MVDARHEPRPGAPSAAGPAPCRRRRDCAPQLAVAVRPPGQVVEDQQLPLAGDDGSAASSPQVNPGPSHFVFLLDTYQKVHTCRFGSRPTMPATSTNGGTRWEDWRQDRGGHGRRKGSDSAAARRFVAEGAFVYHLRAAAEGSMPTGGSLAPTRAPYSGRCRDIADLDRLFATVRAERGASRHLFANAGPGAPASRWARSRPSISTQIFGMNVKARCSPCRRHCRCSPRGSIDHPHRLDAGSMGTPAFSVYSASKAAIRNFARSWALDLKGTGIRVNVLSPGPTGRG